MILKANLKEALRSLTSAKQRTLLALIGIVIGIGSVIGMVSIGGIVQNEALKQFKEMGVDIITVQAEGSESIAAGGFRLDDVLNLPTAVRAIAEAAPYMNAGQMQMLGGKNTYVEWFGVTESFFALNKLPVREGRGISELDVYRYFCVIGEDIAQKMSSQGVGRLIGAKIALDQRIFTVVGVLKKVPSGAMRPGGLNDGVFVHISTATRSFPNSDIRSFMARTQGKTNSQLLKKELGDYFSRKSSGIKLKVRTAEELIDSMQKQMKLFSLLLGAIGSIALIVGGIGVMNVMLISVSERRREIGLRRALGARRGDIQTQFIIESVVLCLVGGIFGIILGVTVSYIFAYFSKWQFLVSAPAIMLGFGVATAVGIFFGYYPARSAARLDPIKALRA